MKHDFRIKLQGDSRAVSYRNIESVYMVNEAKFIVDAKGTKTMIRQYLKSMFKEIYNLPIQFNFIKAFKTLQVFIDIDAKTYNDYVKVGKTLKQFTTGNSPLNDIKTNSEVFFSLDQISVYGGKLNKKSNATPTSAPAPTQSQPQSQPQNTQNTMNENYILTNEQLSKIYGDLWRVDLDWIEELDAFLGVKLTDEDVEKLKSGENLSVEIEDYGDFDIPVEATTLASYHDYNEYSKEEINDIIIGLMVFLDIKSGTDEENYNANALLENLQLFKQYNK